MFWNNAKLRTVFWNSAGPIHPIQMENKVALIIERNATVKKKLYIKTGSHDCCSKGKWLLIMIRPKIALQLPSAPRSLLVSFISPFWFLGQRLYCQGLTSLLFLFLLKENKLWGPLYTTWRLRRVQSFPSNTVTILFPDEKTKESWLTVTTMRCFFKQCNPFKICYDWAWN